MDQDEVIALFDSCSNVGRWGDGDELGTLNHITAERRLAALALPRSGRVVSLGMDLLVGTSREDPPSASMAVRYAPDPHADAPLYVLDTLTLDVHGYEATHIDAPAHVYYQGRAAFGRQVADIAGSDRLAFGSIQALGTAGIVTRGVLLDVAATRGVEYLEADQGISAADLDAAEERAGVRVGPGDAIFVRSGHSIRKAREGEAHDEGDPHEGVMADVIPWMFERDVAVYAADCVEQRPSGYERVPMPLHQVGLVSMGLCLLDVADVEALAAACGEERRWEFLLVAAPLRVPGGTGSPVNPLAVF